MQDTRAGHSGSSIGDAATRPTFVVRYADRCLYEAKERTQPSGRSLRDINPLVERTRETYPSINMEPSRPLILIVEDDDSVRLLLQRALSRTYDVETITNGPDAMLRIEAPPIPDLLICDVMLPGIDGLTIARQAKSTLWSRVPILFLTAKSTPRDVIKGIQAGARQYITKPFKLKELEEQVKKALGR